MRQRRGRSCRAPSRLRRRACGPEHVRVREIRLARRRSSLLVRLDVRVPPRRVAGLLERPRSSSVTLHDRQAVGHGAERSGAGRGDSSRPSARPDRLAFAQGAPSTRTLPWSWYTDPAVLRLEQERIFRRCWQYAGRVDEAAEPGSFAATRAGDVPIVLVRDEGGVLRAFLNVCRQRGSIVCRARAPGGRCSARTTRGRTASTGRSCMRRGWSGSSARRRTASASCRCGSRRWGRSPSSTPTPVAVPARRVPRGRSRARRRRGDRRDAALPRAPESETEANWKVCAENYLECYHCPTAHAGFSAVVDVSPEAYLLEAHGWRVSQAGPGSEPRGPTTPPERSSAASSTSSSRTRSSTSCPAARTSRSGRSPARPERTYRFLDYLVAQDADEGWSRRCSPSTPRSASRTALVERVQAGVRSGIIEEGRLLPESKRLVAHFQSLVLEALA